jgi:hypothetical protein
VLRNYAVDGDTWLVRAYHYYNTDTVPWQLTVVADCVR